MANNSEETELSYTEIASRIGKLFKEENKPIAIDAMYERLGAPLNTLSYVLERLKRAKLVAEEVVNNVCFAYPLAPLFGSRSFHSRAKLIDLQLRVTQQRRKSATAEQLNHLEQLRRAFLNKRKTGQSSREELDKEAETLLENISDIAKTISAEVGTTTDNVLKGLGIQELNLYELGVLKMPAEPTEKEYPLQI